MSTQTLKLQKTVQFNFKNVVTGKDLFYIEGKNCEEILLQDDFVIVLTKKEKYTFKNVPFMFSEQNIKTK